MPAAGLQDQFGNVTMVGIVAGDGPNTDVLEVKEDGEAGGVIPYLESEFVKAILFSTHCVPFLHDQPQTLDCSPPDTCLAISGTSRCSRLQLSNELEDLAPMLELC